MTSPHESLWVFSCCEVLTTVFTRETKMTSSHQSLEVLSCCVVITTFFTRETKMNSLVIDRTTNIFGKTEPKTELIFGRTLPNNPE